MDKIDKQMLNILQQAYPLQTRPYLYIADELGISEDEVIARINYLKEQGIIRRIGAVIDARSMGFYSTLCAAGIPEDRIDEATRIINQYDEVTHNYVRDHQLNVWFTLTAENYTKAMEILESIEEKISCKVHSMPAKKLYKIKVTLEMGEAL